LRLIPDGTPKAKPKGSAAQNRRAQGQDPASRVSGMQPPRKRGPMR